MILLPQRQHALLVVSTALFGLLAAALIRQAAPAVAGPATQTPVAATSPSATPTNTPSPPDATLAAKFARQGKLEAATGALLAVIEQGTTTERLEARLSLARVYLDDGQATAASRQLDAYLLEAPVGADVRGPQFMLARALALVGDWDGALPLYDAYIQGGGGASVYARLARVEVLVHEGRVGDAVLEAERLLSEELPPSVRLGFILSMAQALELERPKDAVVWYERLRLESASPEDQALALWRSASIKRELGDAGAQADGWTVIIERYPETSTAQAIVDVRPARLAPPDSYFTGLVYYRAGRDREAREAFETSLESDQGGRGRSLAARSSYYLAVLDERAGNNDEAVNAYDRVVELAPWVELADDALWWLGRLQEQAGLVEEAATSYERLLSDFAGSTWAPEARFRLAFLEYDRGSAAAEQFALIGEDAAREDRQRALLWQGKALLASGNKAGAESVWRTLRREAPDSYYGLRAAVLLGEAGPALRDAPVAEAGEPDWMGIEAWLLGSGAGNPVAALRMLLYDEHRRLGQELLALGETRHATEEYGLLLDEAGAEPFALYQAARLFHSAGLPSLSSRATARLLAAFPDEVAAGAPRDLWRLAYPAPFGEVMSETAGEAGVPELLLLALVRQESFFDPLAGSSAGAVGLTQVMPATAEAIARSLGLSDFAVDDLYRPAISLQLGAGYLADQLERFDGNIYHALAAYNGGPGGALRWRHAAGDDVDRFLEEIEFAQTKLYVRLVVENLARYRQIYEGLAEPSLPAD